MITHNYEPPQKSIKLDPSISEDRLNRYLKNINNASERAFKNIQQNDIILLKNTSNIFFLDNIYEKKLFSAYFYDLDNKKIYIKFEIEQIEKIIFVDNFEKFDYINQKKEDLYKLDVDNIVCIWSNNEKIIVRVLEINVDKINILNSTCIGIVINLLKNNQKYNLLNNVIFKFNNIDEIF
jgi:hypothetical protein